MSWILWKDFLKKHVGRSMHWIGLSRKQGEFWKWTNGTTFNAWWVSTSVGKVLFWLHKKLKWFELWYVPLHTETYPKATHLLSALLNDSEIFHFIYFLVYVFTVKLLLISPPIDNSNSTTLQTPTNYLNLYKIFLLQVGTV